MSARLSRTATTAPATRVSAGRQHEPPERPARCEVDRPGEDRDERASADRSGGQRVDGPSVVAAQGLAGEQPVRVEVVGADPWGAWPCDPALPVEEHEVDALELEGPQHPGERRAAHARLAVDRRRGRASARPSAWSRSSDSVAARAPEPVEHERAEAGEHQGGEDRSEDGGGDAGSHVRPCPLSRAGSRCPTRWRAGARRRASCGAGRCARRPCARRPPSRAPHTLSSSWRRLSATPRLSARCWRRSSSRAARATGRPSTRASRRVRSTSTSPATTTSTVTGRAVGAAQHRLHPGHQLAGRERLGDVVVGAELEAEHPVDLVVAGGQHDDRAAPRPRGCAGTPRCRRSRRAGRCRGSPAWGAGCARSRAPARPRWPGRRGTRRPAGRGRPGPRCWDRPRRARSPAPRSPSDRYLRRGL